MILTGGNSIGARFPRRANEGPLSAVDSRSPEHGGSCVDFDIIVVAFRASWPTPAPPP